MADPLRLTVLGSGGNLSTPLPTCSCHVCRQARARGAPHARNGNSLFLHDANALIDAPEHSYGNLNREGVERLDYVFLTHWHPDHVAGVRVVQSRDFAPMYDDRETGLLDVARAGQPTVVTTERVYERTCDVVGALDHYASVGWTDVHLLDVDGPLEANGVTARAIPYSLEGDGDEDAAAFVFERDDRTLLVASDDARHLDESALPAADLAVFECGFFETDPAGDPILSETAREFLAGELYHDEVLARIERVDPDRALLTEIEHLTARSYDDFCDLAREYDRTRFASDGLTVEV
ncbi:MAG: MBL fold metallo-hydrolase [Haloarculaceae archaeon]